MNLAILASIVALSILIGVVRFKDRKTAGKQQSDFWAMERKANGTRRKSLEYLNYISIPLDQLPLTVMAEDEKVADYVRIIRELSTCKIVNFTSITNTELKLRYGAPNIDLLSSYDQNYTVLARTLQQWAQLLSDNGYLAEACQVLEFAISTGTDVSGTYKLLCQIYHLQNTPEKIGFLYPIAETLPESRRNAIVRILQESGKSYD